MSRVVTVSSSSSSSSSGLSTGAFVVPAKRRMKSASLTRIYASSHSPASSIRSSTSNEPSTSGSKLHSAQNPNVSTPRQHFIDHTPASPSRRLLPNRAVVSVCKNKHCCRRGANELYVRLKEEAMIRRDVSIDVRTSSCLKHCKRGPAAHVSVVLEGEGVVLEREVICVNVGAHGIGDLAVAYAMLE